MDSDVLSEHANLAQKLWQGWLQGNNLQMVIKTESDLATSLSLHSCLPRWSDLPSFP